MTTNSTGDVCPPTIFQNDAPEYTVIFGWVTISLVYSVGFVSTITMILRRRFYPLKQWNVGLMACSFIGSLFAAFPVPIREIVGRKFFRCDILYASTMIWLPIHFIPFLIYWMTVHKTLKFQAEVLSNNGFLHDRLSADLAQKLQPNESFSSMKGMKKQSSDFKKQMRKLRHLSFFKSTTFTVLLVIVMVVVALGMVTFSSVSVDSFFNNCLGCSFNSLSLLVFASIGAVVLFAAIILVYITWNDVDAVGYTRVMHRLVLIWSVVLLVWAVLEVLDPGSISLNQKFNWSYIWFLCGLPTSQFLLIIKPTLATFQDNESDSLTSSVAGDSDFGGNRKKAELSSSWMRFISLPAVKRFRAASQLSSGFGRLSQLSMRNKANAAPDIKTFLEDPKAVEVYKKYLMMEFSAENLEFYLQADAWRKMYTSLPPEAITEAAFDLFDYYIDQGAVLQVNLPAGVRLKCCQRMEELQAKKNDPKFEVPQDLFDKCIETVIKLMRQDSYYRFVRSQMYKEWCKGEGAELVNKVEEGAMEDVAEELTEEFMK